MAFKVRTLIVQFSNQISRYQIPLFRGAVLASIPEANILFHNHTPSGFRYEYPLIQYKRIGGKAAIVCIGDGTDTIGEFFTDKPIVVSIGHQSTNLEIQSVDAQNTLVQLWQNTFKYNLRGWIPLNSENWSKYKAIESIAERYAMLEKLLCANILSMLKGLDIHLDNQLICSITHIDEPYISLYKGVKMNNFDIQFTSNLSIPKFIGIGKGVSLGHGIVTPRKEKADK